MPKPIQEFDELSRRRFHDMTSEEKVRALNKHDRAGMNGCDRCGASLRAPSDSEGRHNKLNLLLFPAPPRLCARYLP